jgi:hypothetical protein
MRHARGRGPGVAIKVSNLSAISIAGSVVFSLQF